MGGITDSMDMSLSKLREMVKDREVPWPPEPVCQGAATGQQMQKPGHQVLAEVPCQEILAVWPGVKGEGEDGRQQLEQGGGRVLRCLLPLPWKLRWRQNAELHGKGKHRGILPTG